MASRKTYNCFVCLKSGYDVQVFLDGKDDQGKTKYLNEDMTPHQHKQQLQQSSTFTEESSLNDADIGSNTNALLKIIIAELQRLTKLFEEQLNQQQQTK